MFAALARATLDQIADAELFDPKRADRPRLTL
jgi:hypothetical protein